MQADPSPSQRIGYLMRDVYVQAKGKESFPWELPLSPETTRRLGPLRGIITSMVQRDATQRLNITQVAERMKQLCTA